MIIYYTQRIYNEDVAKILKEATNKFIENIKNTKKIVIDNNLVDKNNEKEYNIFFITTLSFFLGYTCGRITENYKS